MMDMTQHSPFDEVAELYDAIRPRYPEALFARLISVSRLDPNAHLLEIAPGTGQATLSLAKRGYRITGVELGKQMAPIARNRLRTYPRVDIVNAPSKKPNFPRPLSTWCALRQPSIGSLRRRSLRNCTHC
jgi:protein-L-isoaspartate O-methyltransferase